MARVNVGIHPRYLSDQHLIAESVEITMITGSLRKNNYIIKGQVPEKYCLGKGHMNFFKPRLIYLRNRLEEVNKEIINRGFKFGTNIDLTEFSYKCRHYFKLQNWKPDYSDSILVRERIIERLKTPRKAKVGFHKYYGKPIENLDEFCNRLLQSELFYV